MLFNSSMFRPYYGHPQANKQNKLCIQGDQKVSMYLMITVQNNSHIIDEFKMAITEYIRNVDRAILNTVFENKVVSGDWRGTL